MAVNVDVSGNDSTYLSDWYKTMQNNDTALAQQANANETAIQNEAANRQTEINNVTKTGGTIDTKIDAYNTNTVQPISARVTQNANAISQEAINRNNDIAAVRGEMKEKICYLNSMSGVSITFTDGGSPGNNYLTIKMQPDNLPFGSYLLYANRTIGTDFSYISISDATDEPLVEVNGSFTSGMFYLLKYTSNNIGGLTVVSEWAQKESYFGVCATAKATAAKSVTIDGFPTTLIDGLTVKVRFENGLAAGENATLNISNTGAIDIMAFQTIDELQALDGGVDDNGIIEFSYNATADAWVMVGSGLAWMANNATYAANLIGAAENLLVPSFVNGNSSITTAVFGSILADIDNAYGTMTSIDFSAAVITPNSGNRRMISLSFVSGATATAFTVPSVWYFVGDDCEDGDFTPAANTRYDVLIEYRNGVVRGYVSGYEVTV